MLITSRRPLLTRPRTGTARAVALVLIGSSLTALGLLAPAQATTTISPTEPGSPHRVVRGDTLDLSIDTGARSFYRTSTGSFAPVGGGDFVLNTRTCRGDNPGASGPNGQGNSSPRDQITVTGPTGQVVLDLTSAVRNISLAGALTTPSYQPLVPQPAPSSTNFRGDLADSGAFHGLKANLDLSGRAPGVYTVTTTTTNMVRVGAGFFQVGGPCQVGTPNGPTTFLPGPVTEVQTFEYRPWKVTFKDVFAQGAVMANLAPREFAFRVGTKSSQVNAGTTQTQSFYSLDGAFLLPSDPAACAAVPASCLPSGALECDPAAGCVPRLMLINRPPDGGNADGLLGVFDLDTKAFIAQATVGGSTRLLVSLGTQGDTFYRGLLDGLAAKAAAQGVDLPALLGTEIVADSGTNQLSLSLLNGLQLDPAGTTSGIRLSTPGEVQAGVIFDVYSHLRLAGGACLTNVGSSSAGPGRYVRNEDAGYVVNRSDLLPTVAAVGPLGAIAGGRVYSIRGKFNGATPALANVASTVIGVDIAENEPNGYPVWVSPFLSGVRTASPKTMDFLGTATWSASETPVGGAGCLVVDFMVGTGIAIFDNPLPVGLGSLVDPIGAPLPQIEALQTAVDDATTQVIDQVTSDPTVDALLSGLVGQLPLSELPTP